MSTISGGTKLSKRVLAPNAEDQVRRVTRQKTKEISSANKDLHGLTTNTEEHALISANCSTQHDDEIHICDEGKKTMIHTATNMFYKLALN
jgi:hypothetical protein